MAEEKLIYTGPRGKVPFEIFKAGVETILRRDGLLCAIQDPAYDLLDEDIKEIEAVGTSISSAALELLGGSAPKAPGKFADVPCDVLLEFQRVVSHAVRSKAAIAQHLSIEMMRLVAGAPQGYAAMRILREDYERQAGVIMDIKRRHLFFFKTEGLSPREIVNRMQLLRQD